MGKYGDISLINELKCDENCKHLKILHISRVKFLGCYCKKYKVDLEIHSYPHISEKCFQCRNKKI